MPSDQNKNAGSLGTHRCLCRTEHWKQIPRVHFMRLKTDKKENSPATLNFGSEQTYLLRAPTIYILRLVADVAELADALDSKSGIRKDVWVRPPPSAPIK